MVGKEVRVGRREVPGEEGQAVNSKPPPQVINTGADTKEQNFDVQEPQDSDNEGSVDSDFSVIMLEDGTVFQGRDWKQP
ncbi:hypothetical protein HDU98_007020 [Podochytrium sp. JEL0797]|nr:hypothetical protein HDU98_007020 [Podochytrium sp. JEL0797]